MNLTILRYVPLPKLVETIKSIPLKQKDENDNPILIYNKTRILLREMHPDEINPASKYIIQSQLELQKELRKELLDNYGIDILNLEGGYWIQNNDTGEKWTLMPPLVEVTEETMIYHDTKGDLEYKEPTKVKMNVIVDGIHRLYLGKILDKTCTVLHISGVSSQYPFYALPNQWEEVKIVQETPELSQKKNYRRKDCYGLYRDLSIINCGGPRTILPEKQ